MQPDQQPVSRAEIEAIRERDGDFDEPLLEYDRAARDRRKLLRALDAAEAENARLLEVIKRLTRDARPVNWDDEDDPTGSAAWRAALSAASAEGEG
ncbi:MAG TPA: hypothetical protein VNS22_27590 [Geminicoccus sp.]|uniref:hypothetical protein n=1 Tax=Geminicoccus sp. TaxID=2024832 RepID=UPI002D0AB654|nr:hypothetical protein [Geminicoccus sp.]HWL72123.1 hypothetical protein [Geminicoccus sp.]